MNFCLLSLWSFWLPACTHLVLNPQTKLPITLAVNDLNRLALKDGRIAAIYGADIFHTELDAKHGQIFLHLKQGVELPGQVSLAITTEDGQTQDLEVFFTEDPAKPIVFETSPQQRSQRQEAQRFFYDVLTGKTENFIVQEARQERVHGMTKTIDLGWGTMTLRHRILSPHSPFMVDYYDLVGKKPFCHYNIRHSLFTKDAAVCGVWLSARVVRGKNPVTVVILKMRNNV